MRGLKQAVEPNHAPEPGSTLDPENWDDVRHQAHRMLDDMLNHIAHIRDIPVWQPMPVEERDKFRAGLPRSGEPIEQIHAEFMASILPYGGGNIHPRFMGWVQGGGTVPGMLAEMLAGGLNANLGGRDHSGIEVERQLVQWVKEMFAFPESASGIFVTGTSIANFMAVLVARTFALGPAVRGTGLGKAGARLRGYSSVAAHGCVRRAFDYAGFGGDALRGIAVDAAQRIHLTELKAQIEHDRAAGLKPFMVIASAGTVDAGAIDDLAAIADLCAEEQIWFHVDGAFGALGMLSPEIAPRLKGIERADSIAFDFHKWGQVPYDAGFLLVRDGRLHMETFASPAAYLRRDTRGLSANSPWPCDFGPDLSRGFRALKTWFTLKAFGADRLGQMMAQSCALARYLDARVRGESELELLSGAQLNIVCFRYRGEDSDRLNSDIVADMQEAGIAAPSLTTVNGHVAIRACFINHRTAIGDVDALVSAALAFGRQRAKSVDARRSPG
jgi:glutamate/tyrosine decarboxylase-like PLP-dependent enzyme